MSNYFNFKPTGRVITIGNLMDSIHPKNRYRWCEAGACACRGCANRSGGVSKRFKKRDWEKWVQDNPEDPGLKR